MSDKATIADYAKWKRDRDDDSVIFPIEIWQAAKELYAPKLGEYCEYPPQQVCDYCQYPQPQKGETPQGVEVFMKYLRQGGYATNAVTGCGPIGQPRKELAVRIDDFPKIMAGKALVSVVVLDLAAAVLGVEGFDDESNCILEAIKAVKGE